MTRPNNGRITMTKRPVDGYSAPVTLSPYERLEYAQYQLRILQETEKRELDKTRAQLEDKYAQIRKDFQKMMNDANYEIEMLKDETA